MKATLSLAKSGWSLLARDSSHDRKHFSSAHRAGIATLSRTAKGRFAKESQDLRVLGCGVSGNCGSAVQFLWQEIACTTGRYQGATASASPPGQHRQQRTGVEESATGRTTERAAGDYGRRCNGRSSARVCDAPTAGCSRGIRADRALRAVYSGPALPASAAGQHADATHTGATAGTVDRCERTRAR